MQYTNLTWRNGQPYSEMFDDIYYSSDEEQDVSGEYIAGEQEFKHVFFKNNGLPERWQTADKFTIAELGFGSGLNFLLTVREWLKHLEETSLSETRKKKCLHYIAIEKYPLSSESISQLLSRYPALNFYIDELFNQYPPAVEGTHSRHLFDSQVIIHYKFMDVSTALESERFNVDAWYLDGFSPANNKEMWSEKVFLKLAQNSRANATCSTYTAAGFVKRNMQNADFFVKKVKGCGNKREMLTAVYKGKDEQKNKSKCKQYKFKDKPWFISDAQPVQYNKKRATIIGAGIAGLSVAHALIKRGWFVTLIDKHGDVAKETSSNPAAIIYPRLAINNDVDNEFFINAFCLSVSVMRTLQSKYAEKFWFESGLLQQVEEKKAIELIAKYQFNEDFIALGENNEMGSAEALDCNRLNSNRLNYKMAGVVLPKVLCDVLKNECGDSLNLISKKIDYIKFEDDQWHCHTENNLISSSEVLVVANGAAIKALKLPVDLPIDIVRGQTVELSSNSSSKYMTSVVASKITLSPLINGKHHLGASYSRNNKSFNVDDNETDELVESANNHSHYNFSRSDCSNEWVGFRAMSVDRVPIVGVVPDKDYFENEYADICHGKTNTPYSAAKNRKGLYLSLGHGSRGFTSAFLSSEIICAQIGGEPAPVRKGVLDYITPSRFIVNTLKRRKP